MSETAQRYGMYVPPDPNITAFSTGHEVQRLTVNERFIMVEDPWVGDFVITDPAMYDLYTTTSFLRTLALAQLLKSRESSTVPNVASFHRGWGLLGQHALVERFGHMQGLSEDHIRAIHVHTGGDDQAHYAYSHKLEFAVQKWGGPENQHEKNWPMIARLGGTTDVLDKYNVDYDDTINVRGFKIPEWAAAETREDIDVDRLQYIAAEALLWFDNDYVRPDVRAKIRRALDLNNLEVTPDGQLAFTDPESALVVSKLLLLFASEHYNDPLARAQLHLDIHGVQRTILERRIPWMDSVDQGVTRRAEHYFYAIDKDFSDALRTGPNHADSFIYLISNTLNASGMEERRRFLDYRLRSYVEFISEDAAENFPSEYLTPKRVDFGPRSSTVDTQVIELSAEQQAELDQVKIPRLLDDGSDALTYVAGPLKNRYIDPLVKHGEGYVRLSQIRGCSYGKLLKEHQNLQTLGVRVSFAFTPDYAQQFRDGMRRNDEAFEKLLEGDDMTVDQKRKMLRIGASEAVNMHVRAGSLVLKRELAI